MNDFLSKYMVLLDDTCGVEAIDLEMQRQTDDVRQTLKTQKKQIAKLAAAIQETPQVLLLGMGASHLANEIFSFQLRKSGIDALAMTASEFLYDTVTVEGKLVILTSQSGESVETVKCIPMLEQAKALFSVTLTEGSTIAKLPGAIICCGGSEQAYAGTRSVTLTLATFAAVAAEMGMYSEENILEAIQYELPDYSILDKSVWMLFNKQSMVVTGRSLFSPLAGLFGLGCEELGNRAVLYNETGTFRHGPMEILDNHCVVVVFRQSGELGELCRSFNEVKKKTGCALIVFDASGQEPLEDAVTIPFPTGKDMIAVLSIMTTFQQLMIAYACGKNPRTGLPRYGSKVTTKE